MDTQRLILFAIFSVSALFLWERWQAEQHPVQTLPAKAAQGASSSASAPATAGAATPSSAPPAGGAPAPAGEKIEIRTDRYVAQVDTRGGVITLLALMEHRDAEDAGKPYRLLQQNENRSFVAQAGLFVKGTPNLLPNHTTLWQPLPGPRELAPGADKLELKLAATAANGDKVVQTLTFHRGSYLIDVSFELTNNDTAPISPDAYFQLQRDIKAPVAQSSWAPSSYTGPVLYNEADKFQKIPFADIDKGKAKFTEKTDNGWIGMVEHYFVAAWLPPESNKSTREFYVKKADNGLYDDGVILPLGTIAPGASASLTVPLYAGPQEQDILKALAPGLENSRRLWLFRDHRRSRCSGCSSGCTRLLGNWGWAIIAMTVIIKSAFYPLNHASCPLDGEDEDRRAENEGAAGAVRERQAAAPDEDDGALQDREDQPAWRVPADPGADSRVHRAVLGPALGGRVAPCALDRLDP